MSNVWLKEGINERIHVGITNAREKMSISCGENNEKLIKQWLLA